MSAQGKTDMVFHIQRIYTKDISFEVLHAPQIFQQEWLPTVSIDLDTHYEKLSSSEQVSSSENELFEVMLRITVKATLDEAAKKVDNNTGKQDKNQEEKEEDGKTAFVCEVEQAGIFSIGGTNSDSLELCLRAYCPNILFPYVRECITSLVARGTFPPLYLAPVNFDALYMDFLAQKAESKKAKGQNSESHQDA
ncbi:protein-export chaperone SecB [Candidatus Fukatsuia symbiotica]|uniref:Protein-export protein SecB n=1 Tax=Candidatus Fukatsuia symbiotica TaxID=1878942 RepID=A0A2U8I429_9GAMM|nr:protein-export chaperone SecB [Candidatus Fukatsuia symbiotica]AWK13878.1 hypothetical protein CCS41_04360 [Candidatus Fukatsuia symbiotica]MEA9445789.1 protein-export chaperone SecB [Candidatus Fukatsuia symbiotica]